MPPSECIDETEAAKIEELRKLSPKTAWDLYEVIQGAAASRKEDHETLERLASDLRADIQKTLADTMSTIVTLVEGLRAEQRDQNRRIGALEIDMRTVKEKLEIPA